ncbi:MAG: SusD/RagB family nutrient-binding outer membrane lipoprotein [Bacteroidota bacterium]
MKRILIKNSVKLFSLGLLLSVASSCTDKMEGMNESNLKNIAPDDLKMDANEGGFLLPAMIRSVNAPGTANQTQQNLLAESYANYLEAPSNFLGNVNTTTYVTRISWTGAWNIPTNGIMNNWLQMKKNGFDTKYPDLYAIALILKVAGGHRIIDTYGTYPYVEYGLTAEPKWNSPKEAYVQMFKDLDVAVASLKASEMADPNADNIRFKKWDPSSFAGDYVKWIKLANTLRLRLAMRLSGTADAPMAKVEAEKAASSAAGGLMDDVTGHWSVTSANGVNGHFTMTNAWSDTRISAAVVTYLEGLNDPRLPVYVLRATDPAVAGTYRGIRPGVDRPTKVVYENYSKYNIAEAAPMKQVDGAESFFLRSEGVLRGWNMGTGTAQSFYEAGIRTSLKLNGAAEAGYLNSTSMQLAYVDPKRPNNQYDSPRLSDVTVKWDDAATFEQKLEKVILQKWIAMFPEGTEAWSEFRRTGYPKLYHIMAPANPLLPLGTFIKKVTVPLVQAAASQKAYDAAVAAHLGGKDDETVKLYWVK